jgi:hypothetical protein
MSDNPELTADVAEVKRDEDGRALPITVPIHHKGETYDGKIRPILPGEQLKYEEQMGIDIEGEMGEEAVDIIWEEHVELDTDWESTHPNIMMQLLNKLMEESSVDTEVVEEIQQKREMVEAAGN